MAINLEKSNYECIFYYHKKEFEYEIFLFDYHRIDKFDILRMPQYAAG